MRSTTLLAAASLAALSAWAAPSIPLDNEPTQPGGGATGTSQFRLQQVANQNFTGRNGLESMLATYLKYNKPLSADLRGALERNPGVHPKLREAGLQKRVGQVGYVMAYPPLHYDSEYVVPVKIGTPGETIYMNVDTGSSDFWCFSSETPRDEAGSHTVWHPEDSSTARSVKSSHWSIVYGDGSSAGGNVWQDRVQIGATYFPSQVIESATSVSDMFSADTFSSGILGLARSSANTVRPTAALTYMDNVRAGLAIPVFTANLVKGGPGNYNFGYVSGAEYTGVIQWSRVYPTTAYWQFVVTGYQVGARPYVSQNWAAVADTGTTLLLLPGSIVADYWTGVAGAAYDPAWGAVVFPCQSSLPSFAFGIGLYRGTVPAHYLDYGPINSTHCYGGLQSSDGIGFSIFGDILLKAQLVAFDVGGGRIGFANKKLVPPS